MFMKESHNCKEAYLRACEAELWSAHCTGMLAVSWGLRIFAHGHGASERGVRWSQGAAGGGSPKRNGSHAEPGRSQKNLIASEAEHLMIAPTGKGGKTVPPPSRLTARIFVMDFFCRCCTRRGIYFL